MKHFLALMAFASICVLAACGSGEERVAASVSTHENVVLEKTIPDLSVTVFLGEEEFDKLPVELVNEDDLRKWARDLARGNDGFDQRMVPAKWNGQELVGGQDQVMLDEQKLVEDILSLSVWEREVTLPIDRQAVSATAEDVKNIENKTIGHGRTSYNKGVSGRVENIRLSTESVDYVVLGSGDTFTFNGIVGERTKERGYQVASVIMDGDFTDGLGGGICQTSTTLYNAVLEAGLTVLERHPHSLPVGYVEEGMDAMVSWGSADLRFRNDFDYPVVIRGGVDKEKGEVWFDIRK